MRTHGMTQTRLYNIWRGMRQRCRDKTNKAYPMYGGRGVSVHSEWNKFAPFMEWAIASGYKDNLTLDRIDNDGDYEPSNCRWVDMKTQSNNKRTNHMITIDGETHSVAEWADIVGIQRVTINARLMRGWPEREAVMGELGVPYHSMGRRPQER